MIRLDHVNKYYNRGGSNELHVMNDVSLELPATGMVALFGKSGCGKTTLLNAIGGLDKVDNGEITVFGNNIAKNTDEVRNRYIGYIFQNYNLSAKETVFENVAAALKLCGMRDVGEIEERVLATLKSVGMEKFKNRLPDTLSGGQQQRVAIARALVKDPAVILADEPTGNLDEANTIMVMDLLKAASRDHLVLLVTHEEELVDYYCSRVIEIVDGAINSSRENTETQGYVSRDKNDIYLGELPRRESEVPGVRIEYYGQPNEEIKLRIVSTGGRLYLKSESPQVKILDSYSEIKLKEGVFEDKRNTEQMGNDIAALQLPQLAPVEGKRFGRLFTLPSAIKSGFRENFSKKSKIGHKLLIACLFLFSGVVVFMTALFAVNLKQVTELYDDHNENIFYVNVNSERVSAALNGSIGSNGIDNIALAYSYINEEYFRFQINSFETVSLPSVTADGILTDARMLNGLDFVCGSADFTSPSDIVITTEFADRMLENNSISFIDKYEDLLYMVSSENSVYANNLHIIGVVKSGEPNIYMQSLYAAAYMLNRTYYDRLKVTSETLYGKSVSEVPQGSVVYYYQRQADNTESSVKIMGKEYGISETVQFYEGLGDYRKFIEEKYGDAPEKQSATDYYNHQKESDPDADLYQSSFEWFFEYGTPHFSEYYDRSVNAGLSAYIYAKNGRIEHLIESFGNILPVGNEAYSANMCAYGAYIYKSQYGEYPTQSQLLDYLSENREIRYNYGQTLENDNRIFEKEYYSLPSVKLPFYVMNDHDYITLSYTTGMNDGTVVRENANADMAGGEVFLPCRLMVHADNAEVAREFLLKNIGENNIDFPEEILNDQLRSMIRDIVICVVSLAVLFVIVCLSIYFIMRSSLMHRIKEIGIYRAIGVSKKNLTFRFMIEAFVVATLSMMIGFIVSALIVSSLASSMFFTGVLYFPFWLGLSVIAVLYAATVGFGTLPIATLLRKTPSEILAKYDI